MLTQLDVFTPRILLPQTVFDEAGSVARDPIQIRNIDGLGPVPAAIASVGYGNIDGELYTGANVGRRNIVLTVGFNPNWVDQTIESLRTLLYSYFMPKNQVTLVFKSTHMPDCQIDGIVETVEPNIFTKEPEFQVSILCPYPYFTDVVATIVTGVGIANETTGLTTIDYVGTVPSGFNLLARVGSATTTAAFTVVNSAPSKEKFTTSAVVATSASNNTELSTILGNKYLQNVNTGTGVVTNIMGEIVQTSQWPQLYPGANSFGLVYGSAQSLPWRLAYYNRYGGI